MFVLNPERKIILLRNSFIKIVLFLLRLILYNLCHFIGASAFFDNILFILVILSVIGYGTRYQSAEIVNLAIMFFGLDIITRYIGFILDFGGQIKR